MNVFTVISHDCRVWSLLVLPCTSGMAHWAASCLPQGMQVGCLW